MPDFTVRAGHGESSATAYLEDVARRLNLTVETGAHATRIQLDGFRAKGVEYVKNGALHTATSHEVVLCGGTFNSPQLLLLSGIGAAPELRAVGIEPQHELPAVGRNLQDHALASAVFSASRPFGFEKLMRLDRLAWSALRWYFSGGGPLGEAPPIGTGSVRLAAESDSADTQVQVSHVSFMARPWFPGWRKGAGHQFTAAAMQLRPTGRGSVTLRSTDPLAVPCIRLGLLTTGFDRQAARDMLRFIRRFFATAPLAGLIAGEILPAGQSSQTPRWTNSCVARYRPACIRPAPVRWERTRQPRWSTSSFVCTGSRD